MGGNAAIRGADYFGKDAIKNDRKAYYIQFIFLVMC